MDSLASTDQPPVASLLARGMQKSGIPYDGRGNGAAVGKVNSYRVIGDRHELGLNNLEFNR